MAGLYDDGFVDRMRSGLEGLKDQWNLGPDATIRLLALSENATFIAHDPAMPTPIILRVHRPNYHSKAEIESELTWIAALREAGEVEIPAPLALADGGHIASFNDQGDLRHVVGFGFISGSEPDAGASLLSGFETLGAISAQLHAHAKHWQPPAGFTRKTWNFETAFGDNPLWGDWRAALGLTAPQREVLERLCRVLKDRLQAYGTGPDRFGLIHADLRLANLLVDGERLAVIDFDDCGFSWFIYDFAAAISFLETSAIIPSLVEAWVRGYRSVMPLAQEHVDMIPTFIMFRRLLLTSWVASHAETDTAREAGLEGFTIGTVALAKSYLMEEGVDA